jgi:DNA-binding NarL/FixJ family response regulator
MDRVGRDAVIRVVVVDDHAIVRAGLEQLVRAADDLDLAGSAGDGVEAVRLVEAVSPDVVVMDLSMPRMGGVAATRAITAAHPSCRVLVLTSFGEAHRIREALAAGAEGYLLKHEEPTKIVAAIRALAAGGAPLDPVAGRVLLESRRAEPVAVALTERETDVLTAVLDGLPNKQIARRLNISEKTVKAHLGRIFQRLGVTDRTQAALWAERHLGERTPPPESSAEGRTTIARAGPAGDRN